MRVTEAPDKSKTSMMSDLEAEPTKFNVCFGEKYYVVAVADLGADRSVMTRGNLIEADYYGMRYKEIDCEPMEFTLALGGEAYLSKAEIVTSLYIQVRHASWLYLPEKHIRVLEDTSVQDEVLLGAPLLKSLGIDVKKQLQALYDSTISLFTEEQQQKDRKLTRQLARLEMLSYHQKFYDEEEADDPNEPYIDLGPQDEQELESALNDMVQRARDNGLDDEKAEVLKSLIWEFRDIFKTRYGNYPAIAAPPMRIELVENFVPTQARLRRYPPDQVKFMEQWIAKLMRYNIVYRNDSTSWVSCPLLVPKRTVRYRFTVDLRGPNLSTRKFVCVMPDLLVELSDLIGSTSFCLIDLCAGYWQMALDERDAPIHSFITPQGVFTPLRVLHGACGAPAAFQHLMRALFSSLRIKSWIDDQLGYFRTWEEHISQLRSLFEICREKNVYLSAKKTSLYQTSARWCGRVVDGEGVSLDPKRVSALELMQRPQTGKELAEFVYCITWMSNSIPNFRQRIYPLKMLLEDIYQQVQSRKSKAAARVTIVEKTEDCTNNSTTSLKAWWSDEHKRAFEDIRNALREAVKLSHISQDRVTCLMTDASDAFWSAIVTQVEEEDLTKPIHEQTHYPLAFCGGRFTHHSSRWSTLERESFAIYTTIDSHEYLFHVKKTIRIYCDHRNILYLFAPSVVEPPLGRHTVLKLQRWSLRLSQFDYSIAHVSGSDNVFPDIISRWWSGYRGWRRDGYDPGTVTSKVARLRSKRPSDRVKNYQARVLIQDNEFVWPDHQVILEHQRRIASMPEGVYRDKDRVMRVCREKGVRRPDDPMYIDRGDEELQLRLIICAHCGPAGHRGKKATENALKEFYHWVGMTEMINDFIDACIVCYATLGGHKIPRPLGSQMHGTRPNMLLHMDYVYLSKSTEGLSYILILKDDFSGYAWFVPADGPTAKNACLALLSWFSAFGPPQFILSDRGTHFINYLMTQLKEVYAYEHRCTLPYEPQSNGTVERCGKSLLRGLRSLALELNIPVAEWPRLAGAVQGIVNQSGLERLGDVSSLEAFTGMKPERPIHSTLPKPSTREASTIREIRAEQLQNLQEIKSDLESMHREIEERVSERRLREIELHNKRTNVLPQTFMPGDFVLVAVLSRNKSKIHAKWQGPRRIVSSQNGFVYKVRHLTRDIEEDVHFTRLKLYSEHDLNQTQRLEDFVERTDETWFVIQDILDHKFEGKACYLKIRWDGFSAHFDSWEPMEAIGQDAPVTVEEYVRDAPATKSGKRLRETWDAMRPESLGEHILV